MFISGNGIIMGKATCSSLQYGEEVDNLLATAAMNAERPPKFRMLHNRDVPELTSVGRHYKRRAHG